MVTRLSSLTEQQFLVLKVMAAHPELMGHDQSAHQMAPGGNVLPEALSNAPGERMLSKGQYQPEKPNLCFCR
ncbi:hypothetical protein ASF98_04425 [Arthrobacter sp. Leaf337]|uniref:hypothetical protein n=1 Tax=unclassified Arthrobacter TaxID=235627 RepID=UPI0006F343D8|nr:hypothetical protein [Arthrobacter sp. Leaf337]KQR75098.1 hypothetical protein ASF98_04425 [Arthrobacter sp. Leaf337]